MIKFFYCIFLFYRQFLCINIYVFDCLPFIRSIKFDPSLDDAGFVLCFRLVTGAMARDIFILISVPKCSIIAGVDATIKARVNASVKASVNPSVGVLCVFLW